MSKTSNNAQESAFVESRAIDNLLDHGYDFEVSLDLKPRSMPGYIKLWNSFFPQSKIHWRDRRISKSWDVYIADKGQGEVYIRKLKISPLYLGTIDKIRKCYLQINYDETKLQADPLLESRKLFKHIDIMIEIAALATLNSCSQHLKSYNKELKELKSFYKSYLNPRSLLQLLQLVSFMSNQVDFTSSIRLTQMMGTTKPKADLIE